MTQPFRLFAVEVLRLRRLSASFLRVTFAGEDLDTFADNGFDQRIKLVVPLASGGIHDMPTGPEWYARWRALPAERRNPIRTYTVRAVRPFVQEVDVDLVLHGDTGPASRWASTAQPGDAAGLIGPDARYGGVHGGVEFRPPPDAGAMLLAGDETAVPAIGGVLERLPSDARGEALLEVPVAGDAYGVEAPRAVRVTWLARDGAEHGSLLLPAVQAAAVRLLGTKPPPARHGGALEDVAGDDVLWQVPTETERDRPAAGELYAWLAGEAGVIKALRRHLVERGVDRRSVAFMGYWRHGRPEGDS